MAWWRKRLRFKVRSVKRKWRLQHLCPSTESRAMTRLFPVVAVILFVLLIVGQLFVYFDERSQSDGLPPLLVASAQFAATCAMVVVVFYKSYLRYRDSRRLRSRGMRICPFCCHDLGSSDSIQRCPECGSRLRLKYVRRIWIARGYK